MPLPHAARPLTRIPTVVLLLFAATFWSLPDGLAIAADPKRDARFPKLDFQRWSGSVNVPDPVAISVADNGDVYVTQTQRRKIQDLDIRQHTEWIPDDVGLSSVKDKRDFIRRMLAVGGDQTVAAKHVEDLNEDGQHDWRDLTVISEKIHRLVDRDQDGTADDIQVFAENFQTEVTGIAAGVMHWGDSVWTTIAPDVWKLQDTDGDGTADQREIMATGFGLHIAYAGHDMHGLTIGPDGKVYWSIGDKGISVSTREGKTFRYPNQGGVMRCNLDGSDFEVYAHGLRNVQEPAFDQYGNLFGVDNDADKPGEKERFVWIVDQMDAGWRCNYQYRGNDYNPWTDEKLWQVAGENHPAYLIPPIGNYVDGPAGFKFNPGTALSAAYKDFFFLTGAPNGSQYAFRVQRSGDSFQMVDSHLIGSGDPIVGLAFGPDGGLYGVDWGGGYPLNQSGAVIRIDVPQDQLDENERKLRQEVAQRLRTGFDDLPNEQLQRLLSHADQRIRLRAQFALVRDQASQTLMDVLSDPESDQLARLHAVWGTGQLIRAGNQSSQVLYRFLEDRDPVVRWVTVKTLGETNDADPSRIAKSLSDPDMHVRLHATMALARRPTPTAIPRLFEMASELDSDQHYLRHGIVTALAACASPDELAERGQSGTDPVRLCTVLALRRLASPLAASFLSDRSDRIATEAARAIHDDFSIPEAMEELARSVEQSRDQAGPMMLRAINANLRLGHESAAQRLMRFVADEQKPITLRLAACEALGAWIEPPLLDRVDGRRRTISQDRDINRTDAAKVLGELVKQSDSPLRVAAVKASRQLDISLPVDALVTLVRDRKSPVDLRLEALTSIAKPGSRIEASRRTDLLVEFSDSTTRSIAANAIEALAQSDADIALIVIEKHLDGKVVPVQQACIRALATLSNRRADALLVSLGDRMAEESLPASLRLDLWQALQDRAEASETIRETLSRIQHSPSLAAFATEKQRAFSLAGSGGNADRGESIFRTNLRAQCSRCHRIGKKGSNIGPELTTIAKQRDTSHLLRAIVSPSADIEPKYNTQTILLADGTIVRGVIKSENDETTIVINSQAEEIKLATDDIEAVAKAKVSLMPEMTDVLSPAEVRDLVAYLKTLR